MMNRFRIEILKVDQTTVSWDVSGYEFLDSGVLKMDMNDGTSMYVSPFSMWAVLVIVNIDSKEDGEADG